MCDERKNAAPRARTQSTKNQPTIPDRTSPIAKVPFSCASKLPDEAKRKSEGAERP